MAEYNFEESGSLSVLFRGSDLIVQVASKIATGQNVTASTFLYGAGKNTPGYATPLAVSLQQIFAPLARGDEQKSEPLSILSKEAIKEFETARPGDSIRVQTDDRGNIRFHLKGQNMGFTEQTSLDIPVIFDAKDPNYPLFHALQSFMQQGLK